VAQPPLPLQSFLALQPLALLLHPPWPLQSFLPLQECLSLSLWFCATICTDALPEDAVIVRVEVVEVAGVACKRAAVPPSMPDTAAVIINCFAESFMSKFSFLFSERRLICPAGSLYNSFIRCRSHGQRNFLENLLEVEAAGQSVYPVGDVIERRIAASGAFSSNEILPLVFETPSCRHNSSRSTGTALSPISEYMAVTTWV
jgi:hypothetical protein